MAEHLELENLGDTLLESGNMEQDNLDAAEFAVEPPIVTSAPEERRAGRWKVSPHFELRATYDDNIFIRPDNEVEDFIITAAPGIAVGYWDNEEEMAQFLDRKRSASLVERGAGNFLVLDYTAILLGFVKTSSQNAFDQDARFDAGWQLGRLTLGAGTHFESKSEADIDVGGRVRRTKIGSEVTARYALSGRTNVEANFYNEVIDREGFIRTIEWRNENYLEYAVTPLMNAAIGVAVGRVEVEDSEDQVFERILGRADYEMTGKMRLHVRGGVEFRQSDGIPGDRVDPVGDVAVRYSISEGTLIVLDGFRRVQPSASQPEELITATGATLRFERSLSTGLLFSVEGGYTNADYTDSPGLDPRTDDIFHVRAGLLYNFASWGNVGIECEYRRDDSSRASSSFENRQITVHVGVIY